jgi:hypothetical protein
VRRILTKEQLIFLQLEAEGLRLLPVGTRREIAESIRHSPTTERMHVANGSALVIEIGSARRKVERLLKQRRRPWQTKKARGRKSFPLSALPGSA